MNSSCHSSSFLNPYVSTAHYRHSICGLCRSESSTNSLAWQWEEPDLSKWIQPDHHWGKAGHLWGAGQGVREGRIRVQPSGQTAPLGQQTPSIQMYMWVSRLCTYGCLEWGWADRWRQTSCVWSKSSRTSELKYYLGPELWFSGWHCAFRRMTKQSEGQKKSRWCLCKRGEFEGWRKKTRQGVIDGKKITEQKMMYQHHLVCLGSCC